MALLGAGDEAVRYDLLLTLGEAQWKAGEVSAARSSLLEAAEAARRLQMPALLARAALAFRPAAITAAHVDAPVVALLEEALDALGEDGAGTAHGMPGQARQAGEGSALRARALARLPMELYWSASPERMRALSAEAVAIARRTGDAATLAEALRARHYALYGPDRVEERLRVATEMLDLAEQMGDREPAAWAHGARVVDLLELGNVPAVGAAIDGYARLAAEMRQPAHALIATEHRTAQALLEGRYAEAEELARESMALAERLGRPDAKAVFAAQTFWLRYEEGRLEELAETIKVIAGYTPAVPAWRCVLAFLYGELGRRDEARGELEELAAGGFAVLGRDRLDWLVAVAFLSLACNTLGDASRAAALYPLLLPYAAHTVVVGGALDCYGSVARYLGLLAVTARRWDAAARHFEDALAANSRMGARPWAARTAYDYARMLLTSRNGERGPSEHAGTDDGYHQGALALLEQASATARELGMTRLQEQAEVLLDATSRAGNDDRSRVPARRSAPANRLTPREVEVLRLLAAGLSSRGIAARLGLGVPTVNRRIANLYRKTGAHNRVEAAAYALRAGLVELPPR